MEAFFAVVMGGTVLAVGVGALVAVRRLAGHWAIRSGGTD